ncbi:quinolinate synthase NadA [Deferrisoma camini]|uniref:quinolinate synthase NadA n=1 Tax=Deferrisoma camini TaxID=1035120 RepID=UPI00046D7290|nr:quinolinate synthase NadA [Deferrisoma camini]
MDIQKLQRDIRALARERNAVILAHNYQRGEVQDVADISGDSLGLSMAAAKTDADVIVFCGVHFMAESAAILSPDKTVILPRMDAGCPMADMITADDVRRIREEHPGVPIVTYVNSSAEVKAESDICCTSANAVRVTRSVGAPTVYLTPDQNLAQWVARHTDQEVLYWKGYCPTHHRLRAEDVERTKARYPGAPFVAHPECRPEVLDLADAVKSTSGMIEWCREVDADTVIVGTETGLFHRLQKDSPHKTFVAPSDAMICPNMKLTSLEDVLEALETLENVVTVPEPVRARAVTALERMLAAGRD